MSILDFLRKIKLPTFDDDFIEDPVDKAIADAPRIRGRVVSDPSGGVLTDEELFGRVAREIELNPDPLRDWEWEDLTSGASDE